MSRKCEMCGKGTVTAGNTPRRGERHYVLGRTKRKQYPNLQSAHVMANGSLRKVKLCVKCLRTLTKNRT